MKDINKMSKIKNNEKFPSTGFNRFLTSKSKFPEEKKKEEK
jgi:hypothetical protein